VRVGILALQGGVVEHARLVDALGHDAVLVRRPEQLADVGALILPGGESTALLRLADLTGLREPLKRAAGRLPTLGTCAGLIMLAALGVLDVDVERNAFGPQVDSASADLQWRGRELRAAFIRAPAITRVGPGVTVCSTYADPARPGRPPYVVGVEEGGVMAVSYHPELTGDATLHRLLLARGPREAALGRSETARPGLAGAGNTACAEAPSFSAGALTDTLLP
jgi:pyridoxal 5'-phosphate synthase, glutaminase subunit pdx2